MRPRPAKFSALTLAVAAAALPAVTMGGESPSPTPTAASTATATVTASPTGVPTPTPTATTVFVLVAEIYVVVDADGDLDTRGDLTDDAPHVVEYSISGAVNTHDTYEASGFSSFGAWVPQTESAPVHVEVSVVYAADAFRIISASCSTFRDDPYEEVILGSWQGGNTIRFALDLFDQDVALPAFCSFVATADPLPTPRPTSGTSPAPRPTLPPTDTISAIPVTH